MILSTTVSAERHRRERLQPAYALRNRFDQRVHKNKCSGAGNKSIILYGAVSTDIDVIVETFLKHIQPPGVHHWTYYLKVPETGKSLCDIFGAEPPWFGRSVLRFIELLCNGDIPGYRFRDFHLSRVNNKTFDRDDEVGDYYVDDPNRLTLELGRTNKLRMHGGITELRDMAGVGFREDFYSRGLRWPVIAPTPSSS